MKRYLLSIVINETLDYLYVSSIQYKSLKGAIIHSLRNNKILTDFRKIDFIPLDQNTNIGRFSIINDLTHIGYVDILQV